MQRKVYTDISEFESQKELLGVKMRFSQDTRILSKQFEIGGKTAPNRLVCQAMEGCDGNGDGTPSDLTARRYERFAKGGAGIIWFEATAVLP